MGITLGMCHRLAFSADHLGETDLETGWLVRIYPTGISAYISDFVIP